jgi:sec-independent protein translocase protein TatA
MAETQRRVVKLGMIRWPVSRRMTQYSPTHPSPGDDRQENDMGLDNPIHIMFLLIIVLLVFGAKRLPEMGHSLGSGMRGFKDALSGAAPPQPDAAEMLRSTHEESNVDAAR